MIKFSYEESGIKDLSILQSEIEAAHNALHNKTGAGHEYTGWLDLPENYDKSEFDEIITTAKDIRNKCDCFLVVGIGGSYLGARAALEFIKGGLHNFDNKPNVFFIGNSISPMSLRQLIDIIKHKDICVNIISKSGTTLEPALAFRVIKDLMQHKYGDEASKRIYATTDRNKGALLQTARENGYKTFVVPDDIGGRFSVLTAVGLLPLAVAGLDIKALMNGAASARREYSSCGIENPCYQYAIVRNLLLRAGKNTEILANYEPRLHYLAEWWKQLFGESEGKQHKGIYPASVDFTTDLHSLGQYIQDGQREMFETVINIEQVDSDVVIRPSDCNDGLNFLEGKTMHWVNEMARIGTKNAHVAGGVPNNLITIDKLDENSLGELFYFFMKACAISGYLLGVNPFDQPGVEKYKKEMNSLMVGGEK